MLNPVLATSVIPVSITDVLSSMMVFVPKIADNLKNVALLYSMARGMQSNSTTDYGSTVVLSTLKILGVHKSDE